MSDVSDTLDKLMNLLQGNSSLQQPVYSLLIDDTLAPTLDCVQPHLQHHFSRGEKRYDEIHRLQLSQTHLRIGA